MDCCSRSEEKKDKGIGKGVLYGIIPHLGCLGFIIFSILGVTAATTVFRSLLLRPYFLYILVLISFLFATASALLYLKKTDNLSFSGILRKKKYISVIFGTTIGVNLLFLLVFFPAIANVDFGLGSSGLSANISRNILQVDIPCPGHAFLVNSELRNLSGVEKSKFDPPDYFEVFYDDKKVSIEEIIFLNIFKEYEAIVVE